MTATARTAAPHELRLRPAPSAMVWRGPNRPHEVLAVPSVVLAPGDALVEVEYATICGSDVHTALGHRDAPVPLVLGHEQVGRVVATGDGAVDALGDRLVHGARVVWSVASSCGTCDRCTAGVTQKCRELRKYGHERVRDGWELSGGFATHVHVRAGSSVVPVDGDLDPRLLAPVSCGTATAVAALEAAEPIRPIDGALVVVLGAGLIGLTVAALASDRGAEVVVVDPSRERRRRSRRFGARWTADPTAARGGAGNLAGVLDGIGREPDVVIEASGAQAAVASALALPGVGGVAVLVGSVFPGPPVPLDAETVVRRLLTVRGVHNYAPHHLVAAARFMESRGGAHPFRELVDAEVPLRDLDRGLDLARGGEHVRVGVAVGAGS